MAVAMFALFHFKISVSWMLRARFDLHVIVNLTFHKSLSFGEYFSPVRAKVRKRFDSISKIRISNSVTLQFV